MASKVLLWQWGRRGGGPKCLVELAKAMAARGHVEVHLSVSAQAEIFGEMQATGLPLHAVSTYAGAKQFALSFLRLPAVRRDFLRYIEANRIDTVIAVMSHLWNPLMVDGLRRRGVRLVTEVHDAAPHPGDAYPLRQRMLARELRFSDRVVALTDHVAEGIAANFGYPRDRIAVIPHGVFRFGGETGPRRAPEGRPFRFLFFGRLIAYKGLDLLLDAVAALDSALPVEVLVAGSGDPGEAVLARLAAEPRIRLDRRWIAEEEVPALFAGADAVLAPYREASQSGVIAAAYGAGLPTVATPVGGLVEQIAPFDSGLVAESLAPAAFAAAMIRLATDPALYERLAANAVATAAGPLSWDAVAAGFERLIAGI